jgi:hypothetical protein
MPVIPVNKVVDPKNNNQKKWGGGGQGGGKAQGVADQKKPFFSPNFRRKYF